MQPVTVDPSEITNAVTHVGMMIGGGGSVGWAGKKLLGPLFDEVAEGWRERYSERRRRNLANILQKAEHKAGDRLDDELEVSGRIANRVIEDGSWCEGPVMAEYFGGVLAASLSPGGQDDRGVVWADLISRLAAADVYLHYMIYDALRRTYRGRDLDLGSSDVLAGCALYLPLPKTLELDVVLSGGQQVKVVASVGGGGELVGAEGIDVASCALSLVRHGLIESNWGCGDREGLSKNFRIDAPHAGLVAWPSMSGIELFLWAHGMTAADFPTLLDSSLELEPVEDIKRCDGARELAVMQMERQQREHSDLQTVQGLSGLADHVERNR